MFAAWFITVKPAILKRWRLILSSCLLFVAGLLPHTYLYVRAQTSPPVNWGEPSTLEAFWKHVSRRQYRASSESEQKGNMTPFLARRIGQVKLYTSYCVREYTPVLAVIGACGLIAMIRRSHRHWLLLWSFLVVANVALYILIVDNTYSNRQDIWTNQVFFLPVYACVAIAVAFGLTDIVHLAHRLCRRLIRTYPPAAGILTVLISILVAGTPLCANYPHNNMRHYYYAYDHAKNILDTMLPNSLILPTGDHSTFPLIHLVLVEGYRPDVIIADKYGYIDPMLYEAMPDNPGKPRTRVDRDRIEEWLIRHARRPVYYTTNKKPLVSNADLVQAGILYHLLPHGKPFDSEDVWKEYH